MPSHDAELASAYDACARLARAHYENFPVASWMLPRRMRPHVAAIYAFARVADDFADEGTVRPDERMRLLERWGARLHDCVSGEGMSKTGVDESLASSTPSIDDRSIFLALGHTIHACGLPVSLFDDLLSAFRQDVETHRYESWNQLLDYCRRSANPVGRLVLRVAGHDNPEMDRASDCLCTALQLTNFWQDLARDFEAGRIYVPREDRVASGAVEDHLEHRQWTPAWRAALERVGARTRALFDQGRPVCDGVGGRLRYELRMTWLGGVRILERLEEAHFDVFTQRPSLSTRDGVPILWKVLTWRR
ncbi:MAG: squalene synthase HpnC [Acidobacteriota bacterium]|nr:squalene synthase HpnC [Acidobacteriota bacterium]